MRLAEFYPAKNRIFSPGRWEAWNKLPTTGNFKLQYVKIQKIRGASKSPQIRTEEKDLPSLTFLNTTQNSLKINLPITSEKQSLPRYSKNNIIKNRKKFIIKDSLPEDDQNREKYSYSICFGNIDVVGKKVNTNADETINYSNSTQSRLSRSLKRKNKGLKFKLPTVSTPSPWQIINKSIEENIPKYH